jgi:hypothetical protein
MATNFFAASLQWVGVAPETVYGVAVATPAYYLPVDGPVWHPTIASLIDMNLRGSMGLEYEAITGLRFDTVSFKTKCYLDSVFYILRAILGVTDVPTGGADPYTHVTALQNAVNGGQPAGSTVFWADAAGKVQQMPGAILSDVKVTIKQDQLVELDVTFIGLPSVAIAPPTNTPTTSKPMPGWNTTYMLGGVAFTKYSEIALDIKRNTEMIPTITGTVTPVAIFGGPVAVAGTLTAVYQGTTDVDLVSWLANTQAAAVVKIAPVGDATHYLQLQMSKVAYTDVAPSGTNKWMEIKSTIKPLSNSTDAIGGLFSPIRATLLTPVATAI